MYKLNNILFIIYYIIRLPGISLEFYGLKTYNDLLDKNRKICQNLFLLFVKDNHLALQTSVTSLDLAFDFNVNLDAITVIRNNSIDSNKNIYKSLDNYSNRFYTSELYQQDEIIACYQDAKIIAFKQLYSMATDRYKKNKPINDYEMELFSRLQKNNQQDIPQKAFSGAWNRYDYDIVIFEKIIRLKYIYIKNFDKNFPRRKKLKFKLNRPKNRVTIYDKAEKQDLDYPLSRIEFTIDFATKISFNDFSNENTFQAILLDRLHSYSLFIYDSLVQFNHLLEGIK